MNVEEYGFGPQNYLDHFFTISVFWLLLLPVFPFFFEIFISFRIFLLCFCFTRTMKIITGRRHWVLTEESPRLTTMDDNNKLTVFAGFYTRSLFQLPAFLNGVAGIHPDLTNFDTCPRILSGMHRTRFAMLQYFCLFTIIFLPSQAYFPQ